jgi:hypothetical protein
MKKGTTLMENNKESIASLKKEIGAMQDATWIISTIAGLLIIFVFLSNSGDIPKRHFASDVPIATIPMKGTKTFTATIRIKYADGKLESIVLLPRKTKEK